MPANKHVEKHFTAADTVKDIVMGMADGLTVPFALAAGLSGAFVSAHIIVIGGLAEIVAGAIAMGLGGYLAAKSERDHFLNERKREIQEVKEKPEQEKREVEEIFKAYGLSAQDVAPLLDKFQSNPNNWVNFMMRFELGIEEPDPKRAMISALTIGLSYIVAGLVPLVPYMVQNNTQAALLFSSAVTLIALLIFGYIKGKVTGNHPFESAVQTVLIGGLAASVAFIVARLIAR